MSDIKKIKNRIKGVKDTKKITNAMYLIASTKLSKAKSSLDAARPFFGAVSAEIKRIFRIDSDIKSKYFYPADGSSMPDSIIGCLVITADKGLAGAYNINVIKETQKIMERHAVTKLFVVGEYGRNYFAQRNIPIERSFLYTAQNPTIQRAEEISALLLDMYEKGQIQKLYVVYTDFQSARGERATSFRLLPFHRVQFVTPTVEKEVTKPFEFYPSMTDVLDQIVYSYVSGFIYGALVYSYCSEQNARMLAMDSANRNAEKILDELTVEFNRVRQGAITNEIIEISSGAKALRHNKE